MTESVKLYTAEVLQTTTQHLVNIAELMEEALLQQSTTIAKLDRQCNSILQVGAAQELMLSGYPDIVVTILLLTTSLLSCITKSDLCRMLSLIGPRQHQCNCQPCKLSCLSNPRQLPKCVQIQPHKLASSNSAPQPLLATPAHNRQQLQLELSVAQDNQVINSLRLTSQAMLHGLQVYSPDDYAPWLAAF